MMLDFSTWRELAEAYVVIVAGRCGYDVVARKLAESGSVYVVLAPIGGGLRVCVRLSDHRCGRVKGERMLSIRQRATGRLRLLEGFLAGRSWTEATIVGHGLTW